jgi:hypothetical protein
MSLRAGWLTFILAISVGGLGCAELTYLTRTRHPSDGATTMFIDAKQRAVNTSTVPMPTRTGIASSRERVLRLCAEPSPDALSSIAASTQFTIRKPEGIDAALSTALAEAAGSIGLRTQSIQLMRDAMYRICEGYLSGALDEPAFEMLHRRFQSSMVAILAIEQLTGVVRPPPIVLTGDALSGNAERAADLTLKTEEELQKQRVAEQALVKAKEAATAATGTRESAEAELKSLEANNVPKYSEDDRKDPAKAKEYERWQALPKEIETGKANEEAAKQQEKDADTQATNIKASHEALDAARKAALAGGGSARTTAQIGSVGGEGQKADVEKVATAVKEIVDSTLNLSFAKEVCATILVKPGNAADDTRIACIGFLNATVKSLETLTSVAATNSQSVNNISRALLSLSTEKKIDKATLSDTAKSLNDASKSLTDTEGHLSKHNFVQ